MKLTLGDRIRTARKGKMTQAELASAIGVHEVTVRRWELGDRTPNAEDIERIAQVLNISLNDLWPDSSAVSDFSKNEPMNKPPFKNTGSALVYERNGERLELPPTEESYQIFRDLAMRIASRNAPAIA